MLAPDVFFMLNFYLFPESCACCLIYDHYLTTYVTHFMLSGSVTFLVWTCFSFFPFFSRPSLFSFIHLNRFLFLTDFSLSPHLLRSFLHFASFPGMSGTERGHLTSIFALCFHVHSSWHYCMPTPPSLIEFFISSLTCNSVFLWFLFPPQLPKGGQVCTF